MLKSLSSWLNAGPHTPATFWEKKAYPKPELMQTGEALIEEIAASIEGGQSVLLTGPRGCGKSYCVGAGIKRWKGKFDERQNAVIKLQGNREVGRDFLMEGDITFSVIKGDDGKLEVLPRPLPPPILQFAVMEGPYTFRPKKFTVGEEEVFKFGVVSWADDEPKIDPAKTKVTKEKPGRVLRREVKEVEDFRFVLFLDEINRFPDGVLDSLLSVLEEGEIYFEGRPFAIPVTVVMTMNPPGYDATARQMSPPLLARIGRSWKLASPDLDTMCDTIVFEKNSGRKVVIQPALVRRACLATLCLWGDLTLSKGSDYLTEATEKLLDECVKADAVALGPAMKEIATLSRFGPDGRAAAEWIRSAAALAGEGNNVREEHLEATAIATLSHRIYDNFSAASSPEKSRRKEEALRTVVRSVLRTGLAARVGATRLIDDPRTFLEDVAPKLGIDAEDVPGRINWRSIRITAAQRWLHDAAPEESWDQLTPRELITKIAGVAGLSESKADAHLGKDENDAWLQDVQKAWPAQAAKVDWSRRVESKPAELVGLLKEFRCTSDDAVLRVFRGLVATGSGNDRLNRLANEELVVEHFPRDYEEATQLLHFEQRKAPRGPDLWGAFAILNTEPLPELGKTLNPAASRHIWDEIASLRGVRAFNSCGERIWTDSALEDTGLARTGGWFRAELYEEGLKDGVADVDKRQNSSFKRSDLVAAAVWLDGLYRASESAIDGNFDRARVKRALSEARQEAFLADEALLGRPGNEPDLHRRADETIRLANQWLCSPKQRRFLLAYLSTSAQELLPLLPAEVKPS